MDVVNDLENYLLEKKHKKLLGFAVRWVTYGYSGYYEKPDGLVIENFRKNDGPQMLMKSIFNPRAAFFTAPSSLHTPLYLDLGFGVTETGERNPWEAAVSAGTIRINHYVTKSYEEYKQKIQRNSAGWIESAYTLPKYDANYLSRYDDPIMDKYIDSLKRALDGKNGGRFDFSAV
jgi:hypothetical protein